MKRTVAVVGGGTGGGAAARLLRRFLDRSHEVILIEKEKTLYNRGSLPFLAIGARQRSGLLRDTANFRRLGIRVVDRAAAFIDVEKKIIHLEGGREVRYDFLLLAPGAELNPGLPPGAEEAGFNAHTLSGAEGIFSRLRDFQGREIAIVVASPTIKFPGSPYEYAFLIDYFLRRRGRRREIAINIYTPEPAPLSQFGERVQESLKELLLKRKILVYSRSPVLEIQEAAKKIVLEYGSFPFDMLIYCPEAVPPPIIRQSKLDGGSGWLPVDHGCQAAGREEIFGIGDAALMLSESGAPLPKMGSLAHLQSSVAAKNIANLILGKKGEKQTFNGFNGAIIAMGGASFLFRGNSLAADGNFRPLPPSKLWNLFKKVLSESWWLRDHS
ncbi:MAG TPA: FAD-dependent oxidoreductase [Bacillota bacterium]|nr:FAD-dependent oxidoreductase [Bacillota bacterium]HOB86351.1 FAD-dependent oxidoreductase [Bacillota bacterium]HOP68520.1 FAD-dependent oxidoreductase [Bacillota bacterium]HPT33251.1 FAD-dependent oxidoreductase [Bacillota bacterium]HPZ65007.1 FAD-dependent oxidoreductase [Bacillota bacterium]